MRGGVCGLVRTFLETHLDFVRLCVPVRQIRIRATKSNSAFDKAPIEIERNFESFSVIPTPEAWSIIHQELGRGVEAWPGDIFNAVP